MSDEALDLPHSKATELGDDLLSKRDILHTIVYLFSPVDGVSDFFPPADFAEAVAAAALLAG